MKPTSHPPEAQRLAPAVLLELRRWNTPTIYNGWEQVTKADPASDAFNWEPTHDFMPQMGPMAGYAVTVVIEPGNPEHRTQNASAKEEYGRYIASVPGPKIVWCRTSTSRKSPAPFGAKSIAVFIAR